MDYTEFSRWTLFKYSWRCLLRRRHTFLVRSFIFLWTFPVLIFAFLLKKVDPLKSLSLSINFLIPAACVTVLYLTLFFLKYWGDILFKRMELTDTKLTLVWKQETEKCLLLWIGKGDISVVYRAYGGLRNLLSDIPLRSNISLFYLSRSKIVIAEKNSISEYLSSGNPPESVMMMNSVFRSLTDTQKKAYKKTLSDMIVYFDRWLILCIPVITVTLVMVFIRIFLVKDLYLLIGLFPALLLSWLIFVMINRHKTLDLISGIKSSSLIKAEYITEFEDDPLKLFDSLPRQHKIRRYIKTSSAEGSKVMLLLSKDVRLVNELNSFISGSLDADNQVIKGSRKKIYYVKYYSYNMFSPWRYENIYFLLGIL